MQVTIFKSLVECDGPFFKKEPFEVDHTRYGFEKKSLDLRELSEKQLNQLEELAADNSSLKGARAVWRDIKTYKEILKDKDAIKQQRARTVKVACSLLKEYFLKFSKHKHVYKTEQDDSDSVTLCYYVSKIQYEEADMRRDYRDPEHIDMDLVWHELGSVERKTIRIDIDDCLGKTPREVLLSVGFYFETATLREDYLFYREKYEKYFNAVGTQMLAKGIGDDEDIDGNPGDNENWYRSSKRSKLILDPEGERTRVIIDVIQESETERKESHKSKYSETFWHLESTFKRRHHGMEAEWDPDEEEMTEEISKKIEVPVHPYVVVFDLKHHLRMKVHIGNLDEYEYNPEIRDFLVLPENCSNLIDVLLAKKESHFVDVIKGKTGGMIILCQGPAGTGKTLTAEVYAESLKRPLYTIQCSQLGTDAEQLEDNLMKVLARGRRWNAVVLLDEADVYVHHRGDDLTQNAIVGVFLRVLEYHAGVLFMTTNRGDLVDDAILSRCTARIPYTVPDITKQHLIWKVLSKTNNIKLPTDRIREITSIHRRLSGRDIKNLLKLASIVSVDRGVEIDADLITEMKQFKPTFDSLEERQKEDYK